jgi:hypothetical protein
MEDMIASVVQNSFAIAVAAYLLMRLERELRQLTSVIARLCHCQTCKVSPLNTGESDNNAV